MLAAQTLAIGFVLQTLLGLDKWVGILLGGSITVLYASMAGIKEFYDQNKFFLNPSLCGTLPSLTNTLTQN